MKFNTERSKASFDIKNPSDAKNSLSNASANLSDSIDKKNTAKLKDAKKKAKKIKFQRISEVSFLR